MCGIAGLMRLDGAVVTHDELTRMLDALAHRGPDGSGLHLDGNLGIGHRRLSIIDLATGQQPIANEDGRIWLSCNGEIYNHLPLRQELEALGHRFSTRSDNEVIVHAYEQWGDSCVEHLRGMFAFAIADWRTGRLFLARDHLGIKPLYYLSAPGVFAFASEINALRSVPGGSLTIDRQAVDDYLCFQHIPCPRTIFTNMRKLAPGQRMSITLAGTISGPHRYWQLEFRPDHQRSPAQWEEALDCVLRESTKLHLMADVPVGVLLSGGVDSSAVLAYMRSQHQGPLHSFSIGFSEPAFDETAFARQASARWGTHHHVETITSDALGLLPLLVRQFGEPFGDSSAIPTYHVARLARTTVSVVLSGDGGDEAFAGYDTYARFMEWLTPGRRPGWWRALRAAAHVLRSRDYPAQRAQVSSWIHLIAALSRRQRSQLWRPEFRVDEAQVPVELARAQSVCNPAYPISMAQAFDVAGYLPDDILTKCDITSMAHGLELRTPLVDRTVMEFAATIPQQLQFAAGVDGRWHGKLLLKRVLERYYPQTFLQRRKQGFAIPLAAWLAPSGILDARVRERLVGSGSLLRTWFHTPAITALLDDRRYGAIWQLLVLEEWLRQQPAELRP